MKKVGIYLTDDKFIGGAFQYTEQVINSLLDLDKKKFFIYGICENSYWYRNLSNRFIKIRVYENKFSKLISTLYNYIDSYGFGNKIFNHFFYNKISSINKLNLDLIIFPMQNREAYLVKSKNLIAIHDLMHRYEGNFKEYSAKEFNRRERKYKQITKNCTAILADSDLGKKHIIHSYKVNKEKIFILPFVSKDFNTIKTKKIKLPKNFIFYPAQFWEHKNHVNLIKAFKLLIDKYKSNIDLVLTGTNKNSYEKIKTLVQSMNLENKIHIMNFVNDSIIKTLYKKAKCLAYVSFGGPTNIPPLEAIKLGCPVVCSNVYGMKNQLKNTALYVNPKSPKDIAKKIDIILRNKKIKNKLITRYNKFNSLNNSKTFQTNLLKIINSII